MKQLFVYLFLFCYASLCYGEHRDSIFISITQPNVYIVKDEWSQQINFDFNIGNRMSETINLKRLELYVYDKNEKLIYYKALRDGPVAPSLATIPVRQIQENENVTVFNPFTTFNPYIELHRLKYLLYFKGDSGKSCIVDVDINPQLYVSQTELAIPMKGKLFVLDGSDLFANHRRLDINNPQVRDLLGDICTNAEMFAVDFSIIDDRGDAFSGDRDNNNYYIFGETVYAPATGKVVKINNHYDDNKPGTLAFNVQDFKTNKDLFPGNCVVIDHLNGEYSFLVHLKKGSITVKEGAIIEKGEPMGQVGNSGSSMYPHLHYQLGDKPDYINSSGLPIYFHNYRLISGGVETKRGFVNTGDIIENK